MSAESLSEDEIAALDRPDEEWLLTAAGFDAVTVRRLLATVRARDDKFDQAIARESRMVADIERLDAELAVLRAGAHEAALAKVETRLAQGEIVRPRLTAPARGAMLPACGGPKSSKSSAPCTTAPRP